jgi:pimeloyl-ACP methyl ester carboxylesterase
MAIALLSRFDVWLMDARGHGASPAGTVGTDTTLRDVADFDVAAVNAFVREQTAALPLWMGYAEGALVLLNAMAVGSLGADTVAGIINLGNPWRDCRYLRSAIHYGWRWLLVSRYQLRPGRGPEAESAQWLRTLWREKTWFGRPARHLRTDLWAAVAASRIPLAWLAASTDLASIHRGLLRLQQAQGLQLLGGDSPWVKELMHNAATVYDLTDSERAQHLAALIVCPGSGWSQSAGDHNHAIHPFGETSSAV